MLLDDTNKIDHKSFSYDDLQGQSKWTAWPVVFGSLTIVGAPNYLSRYRIVGRQVEFEAQFSAATSIASTAGVSYITLPIMANGYAGIAAMSDWTTKIAVGLCHVDIASSRVYLPTQAASAHVFQVAGNYPI
jgi:hypothetical protein